MCELIIWRVFDIWNHCVALVLGQRAKTAAVAPYFCTPRLFYSHQTVFVFTQTLLQRGPALPSLAEIFICAINSTEKSRGKQNKLKTEHA